MQAGLTAADCCENKCHGFDRGSTDDAEIQPQKDTDTHSNLHGGFPCGWTHWCDLVSWMGGHCRCVIDFKKDITGAGIHSAAPGCEYFKTSAAWWAAHGQSLQRPCEVESNIHHIHCRDRMKTLKIHWAATKIHRQESKGCLYGFFFGWLRKLKNFTFTHLCQVDGQSKNKDEAILIIYNP